MQTIVVNQFVVGVLLALSLNFFINSLLGNKISARGVKALSEAEIWSPLS